MSWKATVKQGFRLASGSWKIIAISLPTSARRSASLSAVRSRPPKASRSARTRPGNSTSPIAANAVTLLPEPDSPTQPTTSPASTDKSTPSTAISGCASLPNSTRSFSISSSAISVLSSLELGIECVAQSVAHQIEGKHGDQDGEPRECDHPWGPLNELQRSRKHRAPLGRGRLRAQTEKTKGSGVQDRTGETEGCLHDERCRAVRQNGVEHEPQRAGACYARRL